MNFNPAIIVLFLFGIGIGIVLLLIIRDTVRRRGRWGINLNQLSCPRCGEVVPQIRKPVSFSQALWGGCTCAKCGCELNKWGAEIRP